LNATHTGFASGFVRLVRSNAAPLRLSRVTPEPPIGLSACRTLVDAVLFKRLGDWPDDHVENVFVRQEEAAANARPDRCL
jgi:hypothetical protein